MSHRASRSYRAAWRIIAARCAIGHPFKLPRSTITGPSGAVPLAPAAWHQLCWYAGYPVAQHCCPLATTCSVPAEPTSVKPACHGHDSQYEVMPSRASQLCSKSTNAPGLAGQGVTHLSRAARASMPPNTALLRVVSLRSPRVPCTPGRRLPPAGFDRARRRRRLGRPPGRPVAPAGCPRRGRRGGGEGRGRGRRGGGGGEAAPRVKARRGGPPLGHSCPAPRTCRTCRSPPVGPHLRDGFAHCPSQSTVLHGSPRFYGSAFYIHQNPVSTALPPSVPAPRLQQGGV